MSNKNAATVHMDAKIRRMWALRLAGWLLTLPRVDVRADGKRLGSQPIPFRIVAEDEEIGRVEHG